VFNIGPLELMLLAVVGLIVLGPDRLPDLARDAGRMLRTLRDMATGARRQLKEELGPEFADVDLRNLNPRTAVQRAMFGEEVDLRKYNPRTALQDMLLGGDESGDGARDGARDGDEPAVDLMKPRSAEMRAHASNGTRPRPRPRPMPSPAPETPKFDPDAT
jgi:sec-independent protein translocase protein TatB